MKGKCQQLYTIKKVYPKYLSNIHNFYPFLSFIGNYILFNIFSWVLDRYSILAWVTL